MGISKPSQGWAKHQKDMAVLYCNAIATNQAGHSSAQATADIGKQWLKAMSIE
ncbi:hypothetical protein [Shewanella sp.]|uniref:hypothetical protein n=1 Tax=Shewanella sp. TaxID=50422 RepID=UPI00257A6EF8|nr:hypothetical protein [Shewanella sp.]